MKIILPILAIILLTGCEIQSEKELNPSKEYCMMWQTWHESNGEYGWPDPKNRYETECVNE